MRRILLLVTAATLMAVAMVVSALPAFAIDVPFPEGPPGLYDCSDGTSVVQGVRPGQVPSYEDAKYTCYQNELPFPAQA
jgi:hypothetical protein